MERRRGEASKQERLAFLKLDRFLDSLRDLQEIRGGIRESAANPRRDTIDSRISPQSWA